MRRQCAVNILPVRHNFNINALVEGAVFLDLGNHDIADIFGKGIWIAHAEIVSQHLIANRGNFKRVLRGISLYLKFFNEHIIAVLRRGVGVEIEYILALHQLNLALAVRLKDNLAGGINDKRQFVRPLDIILLKQSYKRYYYFVALRILI